MKKSILILIIALAALFAVGCVENSTQEDLEASNSDIDAELRATSEELTEADADVCYWDWQYTIIPAVSQYYTAPSGYNYAVVQIYIKNNADRQISTNPFNWKFTADGIEYTSDVATFSEVINHQTVDVGKGGELETTIVYLVRGSPAEAMLTYYSFSAPKMENIDYYST